MAHPEDFQLQDPKMVGSSEYAALYELLVDSLEGCEDDVCDPPAQFAIAILDEVIAHATAMKATVEASIEVCAECGGSSVDETPHEDFCSRASANAVIRQGIADADAIGEDGELPVACLDCGIEADDPRVKLACVGKKNPSGFHNFGGK